METAGGFVVLATTDQNLRYQQNLAACRIAILVLTVANWPTIEPRASALATTINAIPPGECREWAAP